MIFNDRELMAELICDKLNHLDTSNLVILAIPPKGIALAKILSEELDVHFEIARIKVADKHAGIDKNYHLQEVNELMMALLKLFTHKSKINYSGKTVLIIDEGTVTEDKILSAVKYAKYFNAAKVVVVVPGLTTYTANRLNDVVDELYTFSTMEKQDPISLDQLPLKEDVNQYLKRWWNNSHQNYDMIFQFN